MRMHMHKRMLISRETQKEKVKEIAADTKVAGFFVSASFSCPLLHLRS